MTRVCGWSLIALAMAAMGCYPSLDSDDCAADDPTCTEEVALEGHYSLTRIGDSAPPGVAIEGSGTTLTIISGSMDLTIDGDFAGSFVLERDVSGQTSMETDWFAGTYQASGTWIQFDFSDLLLGDQQSDEGSMAGGTTFSFFLSASDGELSGNVYVFFTRDQGQLAQ